MDHLVFTNDETEGPEKFTKKKKKFPRSASALAVSRRAWYFTPPLHQVIGLILFHIDVMARNIDIKGLVVTLPS